MMMRRFAVPVVAALMLAVAACTNPFAPTQTGGGAAAPEEAPEVKAAIEQFVAKYNAHDAEGVGEYLADDPHFRWIEDGRIAYENRTAAVAGLKNFFAGFADSRLDAYEVNISMLTDESAVATFRFTQVIAANGQASLKFEGTMSFAMADRDGWQIVVGHRSSNGVPR